MYRTISALFISGLLAFVSTLDEEGLKELKCKKDLPTTMLNATWLSSVERWYTPYWSKLEAYRLYADILDKDIQDLTEEEIENPCVNTDKEGSAIHAFNQTREDKLKITYDNPSHTDLHFEGQNNNHSAAGDFHIGMTDNESYIVGFTCWNDDQLTWEITSVKPTLEPEIKAKAFELIKSVGFKVEDDKYYEEIKYDNCNLG